MIGCLETGLRLSLLDWWAWPGMGGLNDDGDGDGAFMTMLDRFRWYCVIVSNDSLHNNIFIYLTSCNIILCQKLTRDRVIFVFSSNRLLKCTVVAKYIA